MPRLFLIIALLLATPAVAQTHGDYERTFCAGWQIEAYLPEARDFADCLTDTHAIAIESAHDFRIATGRAFNYSAASGKTTGLILVCASDAANCTHDAANAARTLEHHGIRATIWLCNPVDIALAACKRTDIGG